MIRQLLSLIFGWRYVEVKNPQSFTPSGVEICRVRKTDLGLMVHVSSGEDLLLWSDFTCADVTGYEKHGLITKKVSLCTWQPLERSTKGNERV